MQTYEIIKKLQFSVAFFFSYSARKGTPAMRWKDDIPEDVKQDRLQRLLDLQEGINASQRQDILDQVVEVLVEKNNFRYAFKNT
jgi:tRNA-2-methylthio-N6-dimethylallyladenosine synthase